MFLHIHTISFSTPFPSPTLNLSLHPFDRNVPATCPDLVDRLRHTANSPPSCSGPCAEWTRCCPTWRSQRLQGLDLHLPLLLQQPASVGRAPLESAPPLPCVWDKERIIKVLHSPTERNTLLVNNLLSWSEIMWTQKYYYAFPKSNPGAKSMSAEWRINVPTCELPGWHSWCPGCNGYAQSQVAVPGPSCMQQQPPQSDSH